MSRSPSAPRLEVLPDPQRAVLSKVAPLAEQGGFYLAGGTGLALRLGHRESVDFDWFRDDTFDPVALQRVLGEHLSVGDVSTARGTLHVRADGVRLTFLTYGYPQLSEPELFETIGVRIAAPIDLAAMKLAALLQRGERKDLYDLDALLLEGLDLSSAFAAFQRKYGFDGTASLLRALVFFDDAELTPDPVLLDPRLSWQRTKQRLSATVQRFANT